METSPVSQGIIAAQRPHRRENSERVTIRMSGGGYDIIVLYIFNLLSSTRDKMASHVTAALTHGYV